MLAQPHARNNFCRRWRRCWGVLGLATAETLPVPLPLQVMHARAVMVMVMVKVKVLAPMTALARQTRAPWTPAMAALQAMPPLLVVTMQVLLLLQRMLRSRRGGAEPTHAMFSSPHPTPCLSATPTCEGTTSATRAD